MLSDIEWDSTIRSLWFIIKSNVGYITKNLMEVRYESVDI